MQKPQTRMQSALSIKLLLVVTLNQIDHCKYVKAFTEAVVDDFHALCFDKRLFLLVILHCKNPYVLMHLEQYSDTLINVLQTYSRKWILQLSQLDLVCCPHAVLFYHLFVRVGRRLVK